MKKTISILDAQEAGICEKLNCSAYHPERPPLPTLKTCWATGEAASLGYCSKTGAKELLPEKKK
jgi:hypothetical protein